jgi:hypothetical protein
MPYPETVAELSQNISFNRPVANAALIGHPVQLLQRLAFHLQLHLRVLLEYLGVPLTQQLRDPRVRHAACAQKGSRMSTVDRTFGNTSRWARLSVAVQTVLNVTWPSLPR